MLNSSQNKIFLVFMTLTIVFVSLFGLNLSMKSMNDMGSCPMMQGMDSMCQMNVIDHIQMWLSIMLAVMPEILVLLAIAVAISFSFLPISNIYSPISFSPAKQRWRNQLLQLFIPLKFALSRGIIQPKIYS